MKEKIKSVLFSVSIFYSVLIVGLMIFTCITMTDSVELYDNDDNKVKLNNYKEIVWPLPVSELIFVGKATTDRLRKLGIYTIGDLANSDEKTIKSHLS